MSSYLLDNDFYHDMYDFLEKHEGVTSGVIRRKFYDQPIFKQTDSYSLNPNNYDLVESMKQINVDNIKGSYPGDEAMLTGVDKPIDRAVDSTPGISNQQFVKDLSSWLYQSAGSDSMSTEQMQALQRTNKEIASDGFGLNLEQVVDDDRYYWGSSMKEGRMSDERAAWRGFTMNKVDGQPVSELANGSKLEYLYPNEPGSEGREVLKLYDGTTNRTTMYDFENGIDRQALSNAGFDEALQTYPSVYLANTYNGDAHGFSDTVARTYQRFEDNNQPFSREQAQEFANTVKLNGHSLARLMDDYNRANDGDGLTPSSEYEVVSGADIYSEEVYEPVKRNEVYVIENYVRDPENGPYASRGTQIIASGRDLNQLYDSMKSNQDFSHDLDTKTPSDQVVWSHSDIDKNVNFDQILEKTLKKFEFDDSTIQKTLRQVNEGQIAAIQGLSDREDSGDFQALAQEINKVDGLQAKFNYQQGIKSVEVQTAENSVGKGVKMKMKDQNNQSNIGTTDSNEQREFTDEEKTAFAKEMADRREYYSSNVRMVSDEIFKSNEKFSDYISKTGSLSRFSPANQMNLYAAGVTDGAVATSGTWKKHGFIVPKGTEPATYLRTPDMDNKGVQKTYTDDKGVSHGSFSYEPVYSTESFEHPKAAWYALQKDKNSFQTARDVRYKAYDASKSVANLNHDADMNPRVALQTQISEYQTRRELHLTKADKGYSINDDFKGNINVANLKPEERMGFLKEINANMKTMVNYSEKRLGNAPKIEINREKNANKSDVSGEQATDKNVANQAQTQDSVNTPSGITGTNTAGNFNQTQAAPKPTIGR